MSATTCTSASALSNAALLWAQGGDVTKYIFAVNALYCCNGLQVRRVRCTYTWEYGN